jgi:hypothetical protein
MNDEDMFLHVIQTLVVVVMCLTPGL